MRVAIVGGAGRVGLRLARLLAGNGHAVSGIHRSAGQADAVTRAGAAAVTGDLITDPVEGLARALAGHDAVVFSAGAHGTGMDQTTLIDGEGLVKAAAAAELAQVGRFVLVSAFPDARRDRETTEGFEHYIRTKKRAEVHLTGTGLEWIIVRPGLLTDEQGTGRVSAGPAEVYGPVPRDDVAAFLAAVLVHGVPSRTIIELTGGERPIERAVALLAGP